VALLADALGLVGVERATFEHAVPRLALLSRAPASAAGGRASTMAEPLIAPTNLREPLTSYIERGAEQDEARRLLATALLLTLLGAGGSGKTRLALRVAWQVLAEYPDGVWLVELASLADSSLVTQAVAQALGRREESGQPLLSTLVAYLQEKRLLLVLDN